MGAAYEAMGNVWHLRPRLGLLDRLEGDYTFFKMG